MKGKRILVTRIVAHAHQLTLDAVRPTLAHLFKELGYLPCPSNDIVLRALEGYRFELLDDVQKKVQEKALCRLRMEEDRGSHESTTLVKRRKR